MAEVERKPLRINGTVNDATDRALYNALSEVSLYKRMARLRQLAALGLMVEQGTLPVSTHRPAVAVALPQAPVPAPKDPTPAPVRASITEESSRVVTAEERNTPEVVHDTKPPKRKVDLSLMDKMNLNIMR
ncbi:MULTISPECIES: hypothetical protein [Burkholderia cepacia complex]|uniref:Uncharacterized protein n=1 Tax=Burkholderia cepacia TaxID=292 RepID=A0AAX2RK78_BURCE|nr:hypothetical protein [Burkholderia cepacia]TES99664.1 hypothetical protein E3D36_24580 [Burkholderia cepacia]TEU41657.1 hypothetical protein E3D37_26965 [Burkholderia cepacia]TEU48715.1 hypothetical protein E3D38_21170 [Burkholderia cepacia]TEU95398.1 hypothetical protein E3D40_25055 [Burkholderia cepacia]TEV04792.1 hypothetical protein E3D44_26580 [Burkholderia cepacia]